MFKWFSTLSSAGTTLLIPDCELSSMRTIDAFYMKQVAYTFFIPVLIVFILFIWIFINTLTKYCKCCKKWKFFKHMKEDNLVKDYTILSVVLMLFLSYPMLTKLCLSMLQCPKLGISTDDAQSYLMAE